MMDCLKQLKFLGIKLELPGPSIPDLQNVASTFDICPNENNFEGQKIGEPLSEHTDEEEDGDFCGSDGNIEFSLYSGKALTPVSGVFDDNDFDDYSYAFE